MRGTDDSIFICDGLKGGFRILHANRARTAAEGRIADSVPGERFLAALERGTPDDAGACLRAALSASRPVFLSVATDLAAARYLEISGFPAPAYAARPSVWVIRLRRGSSRDAPLRDMKFVDRLPIGIVLFDGDDRLTWLNDTYRRVLGPNAHLLKLGARFADIMAAAYRAGHAAGDSADVERRIAERLDRHRSYASFEEALSGGRWLLTQEIATADGGTLGVRTDITASKSGPTALR